MNRRSVDVLATEDEVKHLVDQGYLIIDNLFDAAQLETFRIHLDMLAAAEATESGSEQIAGNGQYLRSLLDKDAAFHPLLHHPKPLSIGRAVLGPQVAFDVEARVVPAGVPNLGVSWHIHCRVIPEPMPPFFCYPHSIHGLLYLDDVDEATGPLCILPGSHKQDHLQIPAKSDADIEGQLLMKVKAGTCLLMHCNLWHRTIRTTGSAKRRRLILFGYSPAWLKSDIARGTKLSKKLTDELKRSGDLLTRELLGEYYW